jgi:hypothetical protein
LEEGQSQGLLSDLNFKTYNSVGTGDIIYLQTDYAKNRKPEIEKGQVIDKREVETGRGGKYHLAYIPIKERKIEKSELAKWLEESKISNYPVVLNNQHVKWLEQQLYKKR